MTARWASNDLRGGVVIMINPPTTLIAAQIKEWEPRAQITSVEAPQGEDMTLANIIVRVKTGRA
jgi:hypothetical protein